MKTHLLALGVVTTAIAGALSFQGSTGRCVATILPDAKCTPGVADSRVTNENVQQTICVPGYSASVRKVDPATKRSVLKLYGNPNKPYEVDHLISLELGGTNDVKNLWPEAGLIPNPKDSVENRLHRAVCNGAMSLKDAQALISSDWRRAK